MPSPSRSNRGGSCGSKGWWAIVATMVFSSWHVGKLVPFLRSSQLDTPAALSPGPPSFTVRYDDNFGSAEWQELVSERDAAIRRAEELEAELEEARSLKEPTDCGEEEAAPNGAGSKPEVDRLLAKLTEEQQLRRELESSVASCAKQQQQQALLSTVSTAMLEGDRGTTAATTTITTTTTAAAAAGVRRERESRVYTPDATHCFRTMKKKDGPKLTHSRSHRTHWPRPTLFMTGGWGLKDFSVSFWIKATAPCGHRFKQGEE